jgi:methyltransferase (TIGR00027 family)
VALEERRRDRVAASTAEGATALRAGGAAEPDPAVRNPDYLARRFISPGLRLTALAKVPRLWRLTRAVSERLIPGAYWYEIARTKLMDDLLLEEVEGGASQVAIMGAGYDSRAYRFAERLRGVRVFEVDHPVTSRLKLARLVRIFGAVPGHVSLVQVDFGREDLAAPMAAHGYATEEPTFLIWSGVTPYLTEDAVDSVLGYVAAHGSPHTSIVFDYVYREMLDGSVEYFGAPELLARVEKTGEPLRFGISEGAIGRFLADRGLELVSDFPRDQLADRYLLGSDGRIAGRPYEFGGIVHARVGHAKP